MYPLRASNFLLFLGRAGVALVVLVFGQICVLSLTWEGLAAGLLVLLFDFAIWCWACSNPLWVDLGPDGIRVRWLFTEGEHAWDTVKVFWMRESMTTRGIRTSHQFAHFRLGEGKWFKVRISMNAIEEFATLIPESSRGKGMIGQVDLNG